MLTARVLCKIIAVFASLIFTTHGLVCGSGKQHNYFYPWMVTLQEKSVNFARQPILCAGTLIANRIVLTSAHCIIEYQQNQTDKQLQAVLGVYDNCDRSLMLPIDVVAMIIHEDYDEENAKANDLGLVFLDEIAAKYQAACISQRKLKYRDRLTDGVVIGTTMEHFKSTGCGYMQSKVHIHSKDECNKFIDLYGSVPQNDNLENILCTSRMNQTAIKEYAGAPLMKIGKQGEYILIGVATELYSILDGTENVTAFVAIGEFGKWVMDNISKLLHMVAKSKVGSNHNSEIVVGKLK